MHIEAPFDSATSKRLKKENGFLLRIYRAAFAQDPTSRATESARSNLIALRHTVRQVYGERAAVDLTDVQDSSPLPPAPLNSGEEKSIAERIL